MPTQFQCGAFKFVPLITQDLDLTCGIKILFLRPEPAGPVIRSGDIDGRLKTIFDALRIPAQESELGGHQPEDDEVPFFSLLEDDKNISEVSVETDTLLSAIGKHPDVNDAHLVITIDIRRVRATWQNGAFA